MLRLAPYAHSALGLPAVFTPIMEGEPPAEEQPHEDHYERSPDPDPYAWVEHNHMSQTYGGSREISDTLQRTIDDPYLAECIQGHKEREWQRANDPDYQAVLREKEATFAQQKARLEATRVS